MNNPTFSSRDDLEICSEEFQFLIADQKCSTREPLRVHLFRPESTSHTSAVGILPEAKSNYATVSFQQSGLEGSSIYIIGGMKNGEFLRTVEVYEKKSDLRRTANPLIQGRTRPCATLHNNQIHVAGGYNGVYLKSMEIYDRSSNKWTEGPSLQRARADAAIVSCDGDLYVLGGYDGSNYVSEIEKLNRATQKFEIIAQMPGLRAGFGACAFKSKIWIAGGWSNSNNTLRTVRSFDPRKNTWQDEQSMEYERKYFTLVPTSNGIWAVRGNSTDWTIIKNCEKLDTRDQYRKKGITDELVSKLRKFSMKNSKKEEKNSDNSDVISINLRLRLQLFVK